MDNHKFWTPNTDVTCSNVAGLIGKKVEYVCSDGATYNGIVGGADPYVGLSIVVDNGKGDEILRCLNGPLAPDFREGFLKNRASWRKNYNSKFPIYLSYLREVLEGDGVFLEEELEERYYDADVSLGSGGLGVCPFGV